MKNNTKAHSGICNVFGRYDTAFYIFILFTLPRLISKEGISFNFTNCFYTPGLFEKTGGNFIRAFLFELPIAFGRWICQSGMLPLLAVVLVLSIIEDMKNKKTDK